MVVPPKHPKMIIFSRKTHWLLGTTILGNPHMLNITLKIKSSCFLTISNWVPGFIDEQYGKGLRSFTFTSHTKGFSLCEELLTTTGLKNRKRKKRRNTKKRSAAISFSEDVGCSLSPWRSLIFCHLRNL